MFTFTPDIIIVLGNLRDDQLISGIHTGNHRISGAGALPDIDFVRIDRDLHGELLTIPLRHGGHGGLRSRLSRLGGLTGNIVGIRIPMGIQGIVADSVCQQIHPAAAVGLGVPSVKEVTLIGGDGNNGSGDLGVVSLNANIRGSAIGIEQHIAIIIRHHIFANAVEIKIGFDQAAADQALMYFTAGSTPLTDGKQKIVSDPAFNNSAAEIALLIQPCAAAVKGQRQQCIELTLSQLQIVLINKAVQALASVVQIDHQQVMSFFLRNALCPITSEILIIQRTGTITYGILRIIPIGCLAEALKLFN